MQPNIARYILTLVLVVSVLGETQAHGWGGRGRGRAMRRPMAAASVRSAACQTCKQPQQAASPTIINHIIVNGDGQKERESLVAANNLASQALGHNHGQNNQYSSTHDNHGSYGEQLSGVAHDLGQAINGGASNGGAGGATAAAGGMSRSGLSGFVAAGAKLAGLGAAGSGGGLAALAAGGAAQALSGRLGGGGHAGGGGRGSGRALINGLVRNMGRGGRSGGGGGGGQFGVLGSLGAAALNGALARGRGEASGSSGGIGGHLEGYMAGGHDEHQQQHQHAGHHSSKAHLLPELLSGLSRHGQGGSRQSAADYMPEGKEQHAAHGQNNGRHGLAGHGSAGHSYEGASDLQFPHEGQHGSGRGSHGGGHESYGQAGHMASAGLYSHSGLEGEHHGRGHTQMAPHGDIQYGLEGHGSGRRSRPAASGYYEQGERQQGELSGAHGAHANHGAAQEARHQTETRPAHHAARHQPQEYEHHGGHEHGYERGYENSFESGHEREHAGAGYEQDHQISHATEGIQYHPTGYEGQPIPYDHRGDRDVSAGGRYEAELDGLDTGAYEDLIDEYGAPIASKLRDKYNRYATEFAGGFEKHGARGHGAQGAHGEQAHHGDQRGQAGQYIEAEGHHGRRPSLDPSRLERFGGTYLKNLDLNGNSARGDRGASKYETAARYAGESGHRQARYQPSGGGEACSQCRECTSCKMPARGGPPADYRVMESDEDEYPVTSAAAASSSASATFME